MSNLTPLGSGARPIPAPVPAADASESPSTLPTSATTAPSADGSSASSTAGSDTSPAERFDVSEFHEAFAALKQQVVDRRTTLTENVASLQSEDQQLEQQIADWDARANAAEQRRGAIRGELNAKLGEFSQLDEATTHLEATEALLYPAAPAAAPTTEPAA